ncbi:aspartate 1-decarboxylase [Candidatus Gastranaerophilus sp. (ex Termes propinquus)]|nr:aspartate 1-decarboxylase [Candidatus Gastranaerophilus sp. (ex Termes propinquus)]GBF22961.1 aspartate 1-decarboxylase [Candidatus Gastranaerophilus sp. (ex Termes propinquus)]
MFKEFLYAKIHRATVTDANLNYTGSITIDKALLKASTIKVGQKVDVLNLNNGERFHTYVIEGEENSGTVCLNGAAARLVQKEDKVIIVAYALMSDEEEAGFEPKIVHVDTENRIVPSF